MIGSTNFFSGELPATRRVALRTTIVLGDGAVLGLLSRLARLGLGGTQLDGWWPVTAGRKKSGTAHWPGARGGTQKFSWVHLDDVTGIIDFIEQHPEIEGPVNVGSPNPVDNRTFMRAIREATGSRVHFPMPRWMQEIGAFFLRTETELTLKSRWIMPETLMRAGYQFVHPELSTAIHASIRTPRRGSTGVEPN